jgi:protein-S-isoprenylcysteine O-methyltransferase Ste14
VSLAINANRIDQDSPSVNLMPPAVFSACLILGGILEFLFPTKLPLLSSYMRVTVGLAVAGAGFAFMMAAHELFKRIGTHVPTNLPASTLVVRGAYRFSRNPMYVGGSAFFLGIGLMVGSWWMLAAYLPLGLYLALYVIPREEAYMTRVFGDQYRAYCRNVRRWI